MHLFGKCWYFGLDVVPVNQYQINMVCYCVSTGKNELINWKHKLRKAQVQFRLWKDYFTDTFHKTLHFLLTVELVPCVLFNEEII